MREGLIPEGIEMRSCIIIAAPLGLVAACADSNEASATVSPPIPAALGLSEAQLLDTDLVDVNGR